MSEYPLSDHDRARRAEARVRALEAALDEAISALVVVSDDPTWPVQDDDIARLRAVRNPHNP